MQSPFSTQVPGSAPSSERRTPLRIGEWAVDPSVNRIYRGSESRKLEPKVIDVLVYLAERSGQVVTREELETSIWAGTVVTYDTVTGAIQKLRRALGDQPRQPRYIETLAKRGYRLMVPASPLAKTDTSTMGERFPANRDVVPRRGLRPWAPVLFGALVLVATLAWWALSVRTPSHSTPAVAQPVCIAVLPFENLSGDPDQEPLSDGLSDDLITALARNPELLVIARDSSFVYRNAAQDIRHVAQSLGARYILRGSVRRQGDRLRINAQLVDTASGAHVWADTFDGPVASIFAFQDRITDRVIGALPVELSTGERLDLGNPRTSNPQAYDSFLRGRQLFYLYANKEKNARARILFREAADLDPRFALAYAMLGWTYAFDAMNGWSEQRGESLSQALELASKALSLEPALPVAYFVRGLAYREQAEYVKALVEAEKAIEYDPNYANAHVLLATLLYYAGRPEEGLRRIKRAILLNPHHPYNYTFHLGQAYFVLQHYDAAIRAFQKGLESNPASERLHVWLAAAFAQAGQLDNAEWEADQVLALNPAFSTARMARSFPFRDPEDLGRFLNGLQKAGLPGLASEAE